MRAAYCSPPHTTLFLLIDWMQQINFEKYFAVGRPGFDTWSSKHNAARDMPLQQQPFMFSAHMRCSCAKSQSWGPQTCDRFQRNSRV